MKHGIRNWKKETMQIQQFSKLQKIESVHTFNHAAPQSFICYSMWKYRYIHYTVLPIYREILLHCSKKLTGSATSLSVVLIPKYEISLVVQQNFLFVRQHIEFLWRIPIEFISEWLSSFAFSNLAHFQYFYAACLRLKFVGFFRLFFDYFLFWC